jgi:hypothetical protein
MARRGDGIYQRGKTWWLDFTHEEKRHYVRLGRNINRTVAGELARVKRAAILKGEAGIGGPKRADLSIEKAAELSWRGSTRTSDRGRDGPTANASIGSRRPSPGGSSPQSAPSTSSATSVIASTPA